MLLIIILAIFAVITIYACLVLSSRKDAEAEYTYQQFLKEQEELEKKMLEKILKNEKVKKATRINVSFFGENGKIAFLTVEAKNPRKRGVNVIKYSYRLLEEKDKKEGEILLEGNFKKLYPENGLTDEKILDEIIKKEGIKTLSSLYIS